MMLVDFTQKMVIPPILRYMLKTGSMITNENCPDGDPPKNEKRSVNDEAKIPE